MPKKNSPIQPVPPPMPVPDTGPRPPRRPVPKPRPKPPKPSPKGTEMHFRCPVPLKDSVRKAWLQLPDPRASFSKFAIYLMERGLWEHENAVKGGTQ